MKKRLLITSIVMMLVVAVALSTATYAWFTSSATVTSSSISLTAASNTTASLGISWDNIHYGTEITATGPAGASPVFNPACPATLVKVGDQGTATESDVAFTTATAKPVGGDMKFGDDGVATNVYTWNDGTGEGKGHSTFFVKNLSPSAPISAITLTATWGAVGGESLLRVGVFKKDGDVFKLLGVLAKDNPDTYTVVTSGDTLAAGTTYYKKYLGKYVAAVAGDADDVSAGTADYVADTTTAPADTYYTKTVGTASRAQAVYGNIVEGASVNAMETTACVTSITVASSLAAGDSIELVVKVWEDAVALGDNEGGQTGSIGLEFNA